MKYSVKLISAQNEITLPASFANAKKLKISKLLYRFINPDQRVLTVSIDGYNTNLHFDGITTSNYTLVLYSNGTVNDNINYVNVDNSNFDIIYNYGSDFVNLDLKIYIDNVLTPDVSATNPLFLELQAE